MQIICYCRTLIILVQDKNTSLKLPVDVFPLQLVNLHRNRRYFVIKLHTWFCLSYFLKTNIQFYSIYQYFMSINSFVNTVSVSRYSRPITVTRDPLKHIRLCKFTSWSGKTSTGNFSDVFLSWTRIMSVLIGWPI
jgi:hypothetical protein